MKSYLTRFIEQAATEGRNFEKALSGEPTKPPKAPFVSFVGSPPEGFSDFQTRAVSEAISLAALSCPKCGAPIQAVENARHRHLWCEAGGCSWDCWEAIRLTDTLEGAFGEPTGRQIMEAAIARHECPDCSYKLDLQDCEPDALWCAACRLWFIAGVPAATGGSRND